MMQRSPQQDEVRSCELGQGNNSANRKNRRWVIVAFAILGMLIFVSFLLDTKSLGHPNFKAGIVTSKHGGDIGVSGCSNLQTSLPLLISSLRTDPENGLCPLSLRSDHNDPAIQQVFNFPGLNENLLSSAFRGRRIAFVGDSTLFYPAKWLFVLLQSRDDQKQATVFQDLSNLNLTYGNAFVRSVSSQCKGENCIVLKGYSMPKPIENEQDGTNIRWTGVAGPTRTPAAAFQRAWKLVASLKANIVVVNMGLHFLHFYGHGRDTEGPSIHAWVNYEVWLQTALEQIISAGAKTILFKTTNFICEEKYVGAFATGNILYRQKDNATLAKCNKLAYEEGKPHQLTGDNITNYCELGVFNENGAGYLNERLSVFVKSLPEMPGIKTGIFNDHDVEQQCQHTGTGDAVTITKASCFDYECWGIRFNVWRLVKNKMLTPSFTINPCTWSYAKFRRNAK
jgi:hypothetical protein